MPSTVPGQLLAAIKGRKFGSVARLFAPQVDFQAWTPAGRWVATDPATAGKIIEAWFSPGVGSSIVWSNEAAGARGAATLEYEITWKAPPDEQPRVLRQIHLLTVKNGRISAARVYCAGLHTEFPEVDLEKQRRQKGLGPVKPPAKNITTKSA
ncbi:MAG: nuclear transport factor 2 family protein [Dehalococcoidia bacterium]